MRDKSQIKYFDSLFDNFKERKKVKNQRINEKQGNQ